MNIAYVSINSIFTKLIRDVTDNFNEDDIVEWCAEALEFIGAVPIYEEAVAFIEIKNHQCKLPIGIHQILQIARNNSYNQYKLCTPAKICQEESEICKVQTGINSCVCPPSDAVWLDCQSKPIVAYELAYYRPYFDLKAEYEGWSNCRFFKNHFTPVRLKNHTLFNSLVNVEGERAYTGCIDEYTVIMGNTLRTNFKTGQICIAYLRQPRDIETGYPLIPDDISYKTAITKYIQMKIADREFQNGRDGSDTRLKKYESDWQWYCSQAGDKAMMPSGIDEYQDILDQRTRLVPNYNRYYGFFGNLSKPENTMEYNKQIGIESVDTNKRQNKVESVTINNYTPEGNLIENNWE